jgi:hypothetical protein
MAETANAISYYDAFRRTVRGDVGRDGHDSASVRGLTAMADETRLV